MQNKKVLLIDDERDLANLYSKRLKNAGFDVWCYYQGNSAIKTMLDVCPDVILLDIKLPGQSGIEVYSEMKNMASLSHVPVIFLSALHTEKKYCLGTLKAQGFVNKPCTSSEIIDAINDVLETES